jgi:hypothetical protein
VDGYLSAVQGTPTIVLDFSPEPEDRIHKREDLAKAPVTDRHRDRVTVGDEPDSGDIPVFDLPLYKDQWWGVGGRGVSVPWTGDSDPAGSAVASSKATCGVPVAVSGGGKSAEPVAGDWAATEELSAADPNGGPSAMESGGEILDPGGRGSAGSGRCGPMEGNWSGSPSGVSGDTFGTANRGVGPWIGVAFATASSALGSAE